jgi:hypothetical protein
MATLDPRRRRPRPGRPLDARLPPGRRRLCPAARRSLANGRRYEVSGELSQEEEHDTSGAVWYLGSGPDELAGPVLYNLDEFDESTLQGWVAALRRILTGGTSQPDQDWRLLARPAAQ